MMNFGLTTLAAGTLASTALGLSSTTNAAPSALSSAESTVSQLKSQGYHASSTVSAPPRWTNARSERYGRAQT